LTAQTSQKRVGKSTLFSDVVTKTPLENKNKLVSQ
jgi:hypothetical protein